ncbi:ROK family protein [Shewanella avicenniae]|uniref:ROK family protein n=1 Tax=Shewanella avicenniae TaxID=2814294 RepID=A0ABX7QTF8_9GAMM|nr:ROK family protein [Shewanella avicenniae]QSX34549.1 ROK family protein [Shewanella avicenniae]
MAELTIEVGADTALLQYTDDGVTEQYKVPTGEGFSLADLNQHIADFESDYQLSDYRLAIAFPGIVRDNTLLSCKHLPSLMGVNPEKIQSGAKKLLLSNDVQAAMYAVASDKYRCEILVGCSAGMGLAVAFDGKVFTGATGIAGELGSCRVMSESGEFSLDQMASGESIRQRRFRNPVELYRSGAYLGMAIAWAANLLNPQRIWLAGSTLNQSDYYKGCVANLKEMAMPAALSHCQISRVDDSETIVCRGLQVMLQTLTD